MRRVPGSRGVLLVLTAVSCGGGSPQLSARVTFWDYAGLSAGVNISAEVTNDLSYPTAAECYFEGHDLNGDLAVADDPSRTETLAPGETTSISRTAFESADEIGNLPSLSRIEVLCLATEDPPS